MSKLLIFAGTTEGRELLEALSEGIDGSGLIVYACVATDYGKELLPESLAHIQIQSGRLTVEEMVLLMKEHQFDYVIDTTHPYARLASENIKSACKQSGCKYIRVLRPASVSNKSDSNCLFFERHEEVIEYLNQTEGNVLLTIGSKELSKYTKINDFQQRLFLRVLPMMEVLESCSVLGFSGKQMICMQGPFSEDMNIALVNQLNARYIVTKDSGKTGGFPEKYLAAQKTGAKLLVIGREKEEEGISHEAVLEFLETTYQIKLDRRKEEALGKWFPFFTNISGRKIVVIGAGKIAKRRIETLLKFDCRVKVVAQEALPEIMVYSKSGRLELQIKPYDASDLDGADYVLAATNQTEINHLIYTKCKESNIPVNTADDKEKSDFYFPGIIRKNGVTVGVTAEGTDHSLAKRATKAIDHFLETSLGEVE